MFTDNINIKSVFSAITLTRTVGHIVRITILEAFVCYFSEYKRSLYQLIMTYSTFKELYQLSREKFYSSRSLLLQIRNISIKVSSTYQAAPYSRICLLVQELRPIKMKTYHPQYIKLFWSFS